jgi:hypothetical protein
MTDPDAIDDSTIGRSYAVVEAFLDGEPVDPQELKSALADASARDHFVDLLLLREAVGSMAPPLSAAAPGRRAGSVRWLATAAALVVTLTAGYLAGVRMVSGAPDRSNTMTVVSFDHAPVAPAPTRVISLQPGVNWTDSSGEK